MKAVFADAVYWIAVMHPGDPWEEGARLARDRLGRVCLVTTDEVLTEFLNALSRGGGRLRLRAVAMVRNILADPNVIVLGQYREAFLEGVALYAQRPDKSYSLTDCISMNAMRERGITDVLTTDHHFEQEGFRVLIQAVGGAS